MVGDTSPLEKVRGRHPRAFLPQYPPPTERVRCSSSIVRRTGWLTLVAGAFSIHCRQRDKTDAVWYVSVSHRYERVLCRTNPTRAADFRCSITTDNRRTNLRAWYSIYCKYRLLQLINQCSNSAPSVRVYVALVNIAPSSTDTSQIS